MQEELRIAPVVIRPARLSNYSQLIAHLRMKQEKYKEFTFKPVTNPFPKALSNRREAFNVDAVIDGFLHQKLKERFNALEKGEIKRANKLIEAKIKGLKLENDQLIYNRKIGQVSEVESLFFCRPSPATFKDEMLFDLYGYLSTSMSPTRFLEEVYLKYVRHFVKQQGKPSGAGGVGDFPGTERSSLKATERANLKATVRDTPGTERSSLKATVRDFVKLRYNRQEYSIEVYEGRYLWAELYVLMRIGRRDLALEHLAEFEMFFEFMSHKFKSIFQAYLEGKSIKLTPVALPREDKFKKFLVELVDSRFSSDGMVVSTIEDYLWCKLVLGKDIGGDVELYENDRVKFMVNLFSANFADAVDVMLKSDFCIVAKFYLLKEICLERCLDFSRKGSDSSHRGDTTASEGADSHRHHTPCLKTVIPVFLNLAFGIVSKLSTSDLKVRFIEMLKPYSGYSDVVAEYIIKYGLFDILNANANRSNGLSLCLDNQVVASVVEKLKKSGERRKLIHLCHVVSKESMSEVLAEYLEEAILTDEKVDESIVEEFINHNAAALTTKLKVLYSFYRFSRDPKASTLKDTVILDMNKSLLEYKFVIEKVFLKAVDVAKSLNDAEMSRTLFTLCGLLELSEECSDKALRELVAFI